MNLSSEDKTYLLAFEGKLDLIRDRVVGVARGYATGLHLWGDGGCGKSFTVLDALQKMKANFKLSNSRVSGRALFDLFADHPDAVHVLEDVESLTRDGSAMGVLRSALWGQGDGPRRVTWTVHDDKLECLFRGGLILIGNRALDDIPELLALKTRIASLRLQPTNQEIAALMRSIALRGFHHGSHVLSQEDCVDLCEHVIARCGALNRRLDLRLLIVSFLDRAQWADDQSVTHWRDLLESRLTEKVTVKEPRGSRAARLESERNLACELAKLPMTRLERERVWTDRTGRSGRAYYRRLREIDLAPTALCSNKNERNGQLNLAAEDEQREQLDTDDAVGPAAQPVDFGRSW